MKHFTKLFTGTLTALLIIASFGCKNLMDSSALEELNAAIDYSVADPFTLYVSAEEGTGTIVAGGGDKSVKVTDSFNVEFQAAENYQFVKWVAVNKNDTTKSMSDYVRIFQPKSLSTKIEVLEKAENILVMPLCQVRADCKNFYPENTSQGTFRDSTITIEFSHNISEENEVKNIAIEINGVSVKDNFHTPVIKDNFITIEADKANLIDVSKGEVKTVVVTIPKTFYYVTEDGLSVSLGTDLVKSYKINYKTNDQANVIFSSDTKYGTILPNGEKNFSLGESQEVSFEVSSAYLFSGWQVTIGEKTYEYDGVSESKKVSVKDSEGIVCFEIEDATALKTTFNFMNAISGAIVKPICVQIFKVESTSPAYENNGSWINTAIKCKFNVPVDTETINANTLSITDRQGVSLAKYFNDPVFNTAKDTMTIIPKVDELIAETGPFNASTLEVTVSLGKNILSKDGANLLESEKNKFSFLYNKSFDTNAPYILETKAARAKEDLDSVSKRFVLKNAPAFTEEDYQTNHVNKKVWFYLSFTDDETSVNKIVLTENLVYDTEGKSATGKTYTKEITGADLSTVDGITTTTFEYSLQTEEDGIVKLSYYACDTIGNKGEPLSLYVIKDSIFNSKGLVIYNGYSPAEYENLEVSEEEYNQAIKNVYFKYDDYYYSTYHQDNLTNKITLKSGADEASLKDIPLTLDSAKNMYKGVLPQVDNQLVRIIYTDEYNETKSKDIVIPGQPNVTKVDGKIIPVSAEGVDFYGKVSSNSKYKLFVSNEGFIGSLSSDWLTDSSNPTTMQSNTITINTKKDGNNITFSIAKTELQGVEKFALNYCYTDGTTQVINSAQFTQSDDVNYYVTIPFNKQDLSTLKYFVATQTSSECKISAVQSLSYDFNAPVITVCTENVVTLEGIKPFEVTDESEVLCEFYAMWDSEKRPVYSVDYKDYITATSPVTLKLPFESELPDGEFTLILEATDKDGNTASAETKIVLTKSEYTFKAYTTYLWKVEANNIEGVPEKKYYKGGTLIDVDNSSGWDKDSLYTDHLYIYYKKESIVAANTINRVRVKFTMENCYSDYIYFIPKNDSNSGNVYYQFTDSSLLFASDSDCVLKTVVSSLPLETTQNYSGQDWNHHHAVAKETFVQGDTNSVIYEIDKSSIPQGYSYAVLLYRQNAKIDILRTGQN